MYLYLSRPNFVLICLKITSCGDSEFIRLYVTFVVSPPPISYIVKDLKKPVPQKQWGPYDYCDLNVSCLTLTTGKIYQEVESQKGDVIRYFR